MEQEQLTENQDLQAYPPLVSATNSGVYQAEAITKVENLFKDLKKHPQLESTNAKYYELKIVDGREYLNKFSTINHWDYKINLTQEAIQVYSLGTIQSILLHQLSHTAYPGHYHDLVWQRFIQDIGGDPRVRTCGLFNSLEYHYTLCCPTSGCFNSTSELRKTVGREKQCTRCRKMKIFINN
jgi:hypothetical protein